MRNYPHEEPSRNAFCGIKTFYLYKDRDRGMCGIWAFFQKKEVPEGFDAKIQQAIETLKARGPEDFQVYDFDCQNGFKGKLAFARLAINGLTPAGNQPFKHQNIVSMCNGEIYNHKELEETFNPNKSYGSDCEVLGELIKTDESTSVGNLLHKIYGVYAFVGIDMLRSKVYVARDNFGIRPCYTVETEYGIFFASVRKALEPICLSADDAIVELEPRKVYLLDYNFSLNKYIQSSHIVHSLHETPEVSLPFIDPTPYLEDLRNKLEKAVDIRLMSDRPIGALLSGGLDSSLIAALVQSKLRRMGKPPLKTFSIGMAGSEDLKYAKMVADFIGSDHTEVTVTADEMFDCIPEVIKDIESYDITSVRASVGNWMICRYIAQNSDCKVIFNGDGADELFGSYLYFYNAPDPSEYESEVKRLLKQIHKYDVLRSDRCISSHGLEARTPYLDKEFVSSVLKIPLWIRQPVKNERIEKYPLRSAFSYRNYGLNILPTEVLLRRKEAFSDGVSGTEKSWYQIIQDKIVEKNCVSPLWKTEMFYIPQNLLSVVTPQTAEAYWYLMIYSQHFKHTGDPMPYWMPKWSPETTDPSARTLANY